MHSLNKILLILTFFMSSLSRFIFIIIITFTLLTVIIFH